MAVSDTYICYGLKAGHIRALDRNTGGRALFKGHPAGVSCMGFFSPSNNLLASVSKQGDIAVRLVSDRTPTDTDESTIQGQLTMSAQLPAADMQGAADGPFAPVTLAWHPTVPQILAAGAGGSVHIYEVPTAVEYAGGAPPPSQPGITYSIAASSGAAAITTVAFTPTGDLLVAGDNAGGVHAWGLEGEEATEAPLLSWRPFDGDSISTGSRGVGSVRVLHQAADGACLLLTGSATNSTLKLWALPAAAALVTGAQQPSLLQSVSFQGKQSVGSVFCHVAVQPELQLVVLADSGRKQVYTLHYSLGSDGGSNGAAADAAFDFATFFSVRQPILSLSTIPEAADATDEQQLLLYCVQTDAIQQYMLSTLMCVPAAGAVAQSAAEAAVDTTEGDSSSAAAPAVTPVPAAAAAAPAVEQEPPAPSSEVPPPAKLPTPSLLAARAAAHKAAASDALPAGAQAADTSTPAPAAAAPAPQLARKEEEEQQQGEQEPAAAAGGDDGSSKPAAPMPPMPTFSLMHSAEKAPPAAAAATAAAAAAGVPAAAEQVVSSPVAKAAKAEPVPVRKVDTLAAAAAAPGAAEASREEEVAAAAAPAAAAGAAAGVSSGEVAALQQQMAQLLQLQERMAALLQTTSQQTVAGVWVHMMSSFCSGWLVLHHHAVFWRYCCVGLKSSALVGVCKRLSRVLGGGQQGELDTTAGAMACQQCSSMWCACLSGYPRVCLTPCTLLLCLCRSQGGAGSQLEKHRVFPVEAGAPGAVTPWWPKVS